MLHGSGPLSISNNQNSHDQLLPRSKWPNRNMLTFSYDETGFCEHAKASKGSEDSIPMDASKWIHSACKKCSCHPQTRVGVPKSIRHPISMLSLVDHVSSMSVFSVRCIEATRVILLMWNLGEGCSFGAPFFLCFIWSGSLGLSLALGPPLVLLGTLVRFWSQTFSGDLFLFSCPFP